MVVSHPHFKVAHEAQGAFWEVVAENFPHITTGDLCPLSSVQFTTACQNVINAWVQANGGEEDD